VAFIWGGIALVINPRIDGSILILCAIYCICLAIWSDL